MEERDYITEEQEKTTKEKKYVTRREFRICFILLLAALAFAVAAVEDRISQMQNHLSNQV